MFNEPEFIKHALRRIGAIDMFDTTPHDKIIAAAFRLAEEQPWPKITLKEMAAEAGISLAELRDHFVCKADILAGFARKVDDEVLRKAGQEPGDEESARDRLFEVVMTRFDVMNPYRVALKTISRTASPVHTLGQRSVYQFLSSHYWMLNAAGISTDGIRGSMRVFGLASIYPYVFTVWLQDDKPEMPKTMAALDTRLRRGERALGILDTACCGVVSRVLCSSCAEKPAQATDPSAEPSTSADDSTPPPEPESGSAPEPPANGEPQVSPA